MATVIKHTKENVRNPLSMLNTVGSELEHIFTLNGISDGGKRMSIKDLPSKEELSERQIDKACEILGRDDNFKIFLINFQNDYKSEKKKCRVEYAQSKKNFTKLKEITFLLKDEFNDGVDVLDDILDFFNVDSEQEIFDESEKVAALFRKQNSVKVDSVNLKAWLRRGELEFGNLRLPDYNEAAFIEWIEERSWDSYLEDPEYFKQLPNILSKFGVAVILVPYVSHTVYGAVRWFNGNPLVQISDRGQDLATCWFTLFHEFGHVIKHRNEDVFDGTQNETKSKTDRREAEANKFANQYLFNGDNLRKRIFNNIRTQTYMNASSLSNEFDVNLLFVSYWLIKAQYQPTIQKRVHIDFGIGYR